MANPSYRLQGDAGENSLSLLSVAPGTQLNVVVNRSDLKIAIRQTMQRPLLYDLRSLMNIDIKVSRDDKGYHFDATMAYRIAMPAVEVIEVAIRNVGGSSQAEAEHALFIALRDELNRQFNELYPPKP